MREMKYMPIRLSNPIILANGVQGDYTYFVLNMGTHPCAYVGIPEGKRFYNIPYSDIPVRCHGGLTFCGNGFWADNNDKNRYYIDWDYAHCYDFLGYFLDSLVSDLFYGDHTGKKWTTQEMVDECLDVISQLERLE